MGNPSKVRPLRIPTPKEQTPNPYKVSFQHGSDKTWLHHRRGPKELFAIKEIRILNLMEMPQSPRLSPLEPTPWS